MGSQLNLGVRRTPLIISADSAVMDDRRADYVVVASEPESWRRNAHTLRRAADSVYASMAPAMSAAVRGEDAPDDELFLTGPYLMLSGMAVENLLKGVLVRRGAEIVEGGQLRRLGGGDGHDLLTLAGRVSQPLAESHKDLLRRLATHVRWGGRYPIPSRAEQFVTSEREDGSWSPRRYLTTDPEEIAALCAALEPLLDEESRYHDA